MILSLLYHKRKIFTHKKKGKKALKPPQAKSKKIKFTAIELAEKITPHFVYMILPLFQKIFSAIKTSIPHKKPKTEEPKLAITPPPTKIISKQQPVNSEEANKTNRLAKRVIAAYASEPKQPSIELANKHIKISELDDFINSTSANETLTHINGQLEKILKNRKKHLNIKYGNNNKKKSISYFLRDASTLYPEHLQITGKSKVIFLKLAKLNNSLTNSEAIKAMRASFPTNLVQLIESCITEFEKHKEKRYTDREKHLKSS